MEAFVELVAAGQGRTSTRWSASGSRSTTRRPRTSSLVGEERSPLGILLEYDGDAGAPRRRAAPASVPAARDRGSRRRDRRRQLRAADPDPGLKRAGFALSRGRERERAVRARGGRPFGFGRAASVEEVLADPGRRRWWRSRRGTPRMRRWRCAALRAGKAVFVEKPPCLDRDELGELEQRSRHSGQPLVVGFNRRHAPLARRFRDHVAGGAPAVRAALPRQRGAAARRPLAERPRRGRRPAARRGLPLRRLRLLARRRAA